MTEKFEMVAKTFQGLEGVLSDELTALGAEEVTQGRRMVSFKGNKELLYRANFQLRTALRILKPIYKFRSSDADDLYEQVKKFDWSSIMTSSTTFAIDSTVFSEDFRHSRFVTYRVKDAIADYFMEREGKRPSIRLTSPERNFDVHISDNDVTISLDSSGEPLYRRGWRLYQADAPINEVLAAGIIKLSGWDGQTDFVDPMCGSGTFLVEAALIAANINPGVYRKEYSFQHWPDYDADLFSEIYNDDSGEREFTHKIYGTDIARQAVAMTERNVKNAGMGKYIEVQQRAIEDWTPENAPKQGGTLVTNPPYGVRLEAGEALYQTLGDKFKNVFKGFNCWVISAAENELFDQIHLRPSVHYPLLNGSLECELREYVIFDGSYDQMRERGETIHNGDFRRSEDKHHLKRQEFVPTFGNNDGEGEQPEADGDARRDNERPKRDYGDRRPRERRDDDGRERKPFGRRGDDGRRPRADFKPRREGDRDFRPRRDGDGESRGFNRGDGYDSQGKRIWPSRGGKRRDDDGRERKPFGRRDDGERRPRRFSNEGDGGDRERRPFAGRERKPFRRDEGDGSREARYGERGGDESQPQDYYHTEKFARNMVQFRQPSLGKDSEREIFHGRRKGWTRMKDTPAEKPNDNETNANDNKNNEKE